MINDTIIPDGDNIWIIPFDASVTAFKPYAATIWCECDGSGSCQAQPAYQREYTCTPYACSKCVLIVCPRTGGVYGGGILVEANTVIEE